MGGHRSQRLESIGRGGRVRASRRRLLRRPRPAPPARRLARRRRGGGARGAAARPRAWAPAPRASARWPARRGRARAARRSSPGREALVGRACRPPARLRGDRADSSSRSSSSGSTTLGAVAALPAAALADRFGRRGPAGPRARPGQDTPLRPRAAGEALEESLELAESASGIQLYRALDLLVDRLLARRERRGRTLRAVVLGARLVEGGTWRERVVFREALADPARMRLALTGRLALLPAPAERSSWPSSASGRRTRRAQALFDDGGAVRRDAPAGGGAPGARGGGSRRGAARPAVEPDSRVPERRAVLTPFE